MVIADEITIPMNAMTPRFDFYLSEAYKTLPVGCAKGRSYFDQVERQLEGLRMRLHCRRQLARREEGGRTLSYCSALVPLRIPSSWRRCTAWC